MMKLGTLAAPAGYPAHRRHSGPHAHCPTRSLPSLQAEPRVCLNQPSFCLATTPTCSTACR
jgi:hypothetical protein